MSILFNMFATLILTAHLLCVDVAMMGPLACALLRRRATRLDDRLADRAGRCMVSLCLAALLTAIALGLISGLMLWFGSQRQFFEALGRIPARRLYWGVAELGFYFLCMVLYGALWEKWRRRTLLHGFLAIVAATNLIYHFPPLFVTINSMAATSDGNTSLLTISELRQLMFSPLILAHMTHHLVAAVACTAVCLMLVLRYVAAGQPKNPTADDEAARSQLVRRSAIVALTVSLLQLPVGLGLLLQLTGMQRDVIMGGDWITTGMFVAAMVCVLALLHWLSMISLGQTERRDVIVVALLLVLVTALMTGVLRRIRSHEVADRIRRAPSVVDPWGGEPAELKSSAFNSLFVRARSCIPPASRCATTARADRQRWCPVEGRRPGWRLCRR